MAVIFLLRAVICTGVLEMLSCCKTYKAKSRCWVIFLNVLLHLKIGLTLNIGGGRGCNRNRKGYIHQYNIDWYWLIDWLIDALHQYDHPPRSIDSLIHSFIHSFIDSLPSSIRSSSPGSSVRVARARLMRPTPSTRWSLLCPFYFKIFYWWSLLCLFYFKFFFWWSLLCLLYFKILFGLECS